MPQKNNFQITKIFLQEVWSLEQVKNYMRVEANYDDDLILGLIDAAITAAENFTKLNFISKQIKFVCNIYGKREFLLKYNPVLRILKVTKKFKDQENELTLDDYIIDQNILALTKSLNNEELTVEYISGYDKDNIPHAIKHGIMLHIAEMYDRQAQNCAGLSKEVKNLYLPYRNIRM
ncbi:MAG TPA: head-tail connector protein [Rickettsia endosymbiont of Bembidion nr. Transversale]|nr:head-tail connector protein [Rickettsia endosymbiont of Bembidion nr. Transversale]